MEMRLLSDGAAKLHSISCANWPGVDSRRGRPVCLFNFPRESVKAILLGCRATEELPDVVVDIVRNTPGYARVEVYRGSVDETDFRINLTRIWPADQ